jgi:RimJ/RimL family protein N-acetyltransferase
MNYYKALSKQFIINGDYSIVPIRQSDRYFIMKWRNEQMYHLRQTKELTKETQDHYFDNILSKAFSEEKPNQILFSYLFKDVLVGYGGLVHINWIDYNAEISFIMNTELENIFFEIHWENFLKLIEQVAFFDLKFHKIYTYAFDLRPGLYKVLENSGYTKEAILKDQTHFNNKFIDVVIHAKIYG